jgi:hypothetical protein
LLWVKVFFSGGISSSVLFDAVCRFVALSRHVSVKGSDPSVKELMAVLRRGGFSSFQFVRANSIQYLPEFFENCFVPSIVILNHGARQA